MATKKEEAVQDAPVETKPQSKELITATKIFQDGLAANQTRDQIIVSMVQGGLSLNFSQNTYKALAKEAGLETIRGGHKAEAIQHLEGLKIKTEEFVTTETRAKLRTQLQEKFGVAESTANDYIKAYAAKHEIELPGGGGPTSEMSGHIFDFVMANPDCEKAQFKEFMEGYNRSKGNIDENWRGVLLARKLLENGYKYTAPKAA
jgi:hypothetical protein